MACATLATRRVRRYGVTPGCQCRRTVAGGVLKGLLGGHEWGMGVPEGIWAVNAAN